MILVSNNSASLLGFQIVLFVVATFLLYRFVKYKRSISFEKRLTKYSDEFSNKDLIDFFKTFQTTLQNTDKTLDNVPQISITQNQLNLSIEPPEFDQDSRQRILNAVRLLLSQQPEENNQEGLVEINDE